MSIAVAVRGRDEIVIASDSKRTFGSGAVPEANLSDLKIRKVGNAYLAATGWGIYSNILDDYLVQKKRASLLDAHSIFSFFKRFWKDLHEHYSFVSDQRNDDESPFGDLDASFLVTSPRGIFSIACDMSVTEFKQYYAIGSGAPYALGALHALHEPGVDPEATARKAVAAASALDIYCGGETVVRRLRAAPLRLRRSDANV